MAKGSGHGSQVIHDRSRTTRNQSRTFRISSSTLKLLCLLVILPKHSGHPPLHHRFHLLHLLHTSTPPHLHLHLLLVTSKPTRQFSLAATTWHLWNTISHSPHLAPLLCSTETGHISACRQSRYPKCCVRLSSGVRFNTDPSKLCSQSSVNVPRQVRHGSTRHNLHHNQPVDCAPNQTT